MIISIASGKGGTGKTTVAVNMALSVGKKVLLLDCDVEEPNCHLFIRPVSERIESVLLPVPEINQARCNHCGKCGDICQFKAIVCAGEIVMTFPELCHSCGGCVRICPENAITEIGRKAGEIHHGRRGDVKLVYGIMDVGLAMSPPLIRKVRTYGETSPLTIADAPPGTSCPVITAIRNTDFVVLVTEPTPFGLHDLKLAVEVVRSLNIPHGLVINRSGIGNDGVKQYAETENIPILMEIPFERRIAELYSEGKILCEAEPSWQTQFREMYHRIRYMVE